MAHVLLVGKIRDENFGPIFCRMNRWADSRGEDPSELIRVGMLSDIGLFWVLTSALSLPFVLTYPAVISATSESVSWRRGHADPDYNIGKECDLRSVLLGLTVSCGACCGVGRHLG